MTSNQPYMLKTLLLSSFTILFQDSCGGLELENPHLPGSFVAATPIPDTLVLNIGDMLQRITNGTKSTSLYILSKLRLFRTTYLLLLTFSLDTFQSATHRVTLPPIVQSSSNLASRITSARYSIPYFFAPDDNAMIETLPSKVDVDGGHPAKYESIVYREYAAHIAKYSYQKDGGEAIKV